MVVFFHASEIHDVLSPTIFSNKDGAVSPILVLVIGWFYKLPPHIVIKIL